MRTLLFKYNAMFAFVTKRATSTRGIAGAAKLQVHISKACFLESTEMEQSYCTMCCYHYENLATTVREYKTLRLSEFFRMTPVIMQPGRAANQDRESRDSMLKEHTKALEYAIGKQNLFGVPKEEEFIPMRHAKNVVKQEDPITKMKKYAHRNRKLFNPSQLIVLDKVIDMPENDILLI